MPREIKSITDIRAEARKHTKTALNVLVGIARQPKAPHAARVAAASAIINRGWGMPQQDIGITPSDAFIQALKQINAIHQSEDEPVEQVTH